MLLKEEGYLSDNPNDSGGLTKFGISQKSYPNLDIAKITQEEAADIYRNDFYNSLKIEMIKDEKIAYEVFDYAVNGGITSSAIALQASLHYLGSKIVIDGEVGLKTISECNSYKDQSLLLYVLTSFRMHKYFNICDKWPKNLEFFEGWARRTRRCLNASKA